MVEQNSEAGIYIDAEKSVFPASLLGRTWSQGESLSLETYLGNSDILQGLVVKPQSSRIPGP